MDESDNVALCQACLWGAARPAQPLSDAAAPVMPFVQARSDGEELPDERPSLAPRQRGVPSEHPSIQPVQLPVAQQRAIALGSVQRQDQPFEPLEWPDARRPPAHRRSVRQ